MLNTAVDYWLWKLNVTGAGSDLKYSGSILRLQNSGVFVSVDMLTVIGGGRVVLIVVDYFAQSVIVQYLLPVTMGLTSDIV